MINLSSQQSLAKVLQLKHQLQNTKKGDSSISDFVLKIKTIGDSLKVAGQNVSDNDLLLSVLHGVGHEYDSVVTVVTSQWSSTSFQEVDQAFLWSLFKVFGRVRDIYLSAATERRKIGYAFVRFGTIEKARRVADKTNDKEGAIENIDAETVELVVTESLVSEVDKGTRLRKRLDSTRLLLLVSPAKKLDAEVAEVVEKVVGSGINPKGCKKEKSRGVIRKQSNDDRGQIGVQIEGFRQFGGAWLTRGVGVDSEGASNGLITLWKEDRFLVKACISSRSCIILVGELAKILFSILWVIGGDFNTVLFQSERVDVGLNLGDMESFRRFILQDQTGLFRSLSDHNPNLLSDLKMDWGPIPFRFYNNWLEEKALMKEALMGWVNCKENGSNGVVLRSKLKASKIGIKNWLVMHKESEVNSKALESQLGLKDSQAVHHGCTDQSRFQKRSLIEELWKALHMEEQLWRQKSRVDWLKESNRNTSFFHFMANGRRKSNFIGEIFHDGALCSDNVSIRKSVYRSFSNHFKVGNWVRPTMRGECSKGFQRKKRIRLRCPLV
ncbi:hypothetical protein Ddye_028018 [Dipteronia dyeriana]|uniref:RRM domain-containing protein n=1 Tax=Dipteronia dyeriana TaxID=168575 RepID=A0AAD9TR26_9ROSI|nr:hypothetical protein Ddye_028018 [Dipteronia dyeriana]